MAVGRALLCLCHLSTTFTHAGESSGGGCLGVYHSVSVWLGRFYIFWYLSLLIWKRSSRFKTSTIVQFVESWSVVVWREQGTVSQRCLETNMHNFYLSDPFAHPLPVSFIAKVNLIRKNRAIYFYNKTNVSGPGFCVVVLRWVFHAMEMSWRMSAVLGRKSWGENENLLCKQRDHKVL